MTGLELPSPSADRDERQTQLKKLVTDLLLKLDPALSIYKLNYVRVIKGPKPSILEVECENAARYFPCKISFLLTKKAYPGFLISIESLCHFFKNDNEVQLFILHNVLQSAWM